MLIEELEKLKTGGQPQTLDELFQSSKENILFERINKSLKEVVFNFREQVKKELKDMISQITKEELSGISAENLKKGANEIVEATKTRLSDMSLRLIEEIESSTYQSKNLKEIAFLTKDKALKSLEKDVSNLIEEAISKVKSETKVEVKTPIDIKKNLESLEGDKRLDVSAIKGIQEMVYLLTPRKSSGGKGGGGSTLRVDNLSNQCDGATRDFTTNYKIGSAHLVIYSSFPTLFLPITDYTVSGNVVSISASLSAPASGQSLAIIYEDAT